MYMSHKLTIIFLMILMPSFVSAQGAGGHISRPIKKQEEKPAKRVVQTGTQTMSKSERDRIIKKLITNMVYVEGGTFTMGQDTHYAHLEKLYEFKIGKYEITQEEWRAVMGNNPSWFKGHKLPVENVSWNDCQEFFKKLNAMTGKNFRLPTEAEWEYAARGGNFSRRYKYSGGDDVKKVAWCDENSTHKTHKVGTKAANELGLYDMSGNVFEWCSDSIHNDSKQNYYMTRGGDYDCIISNCENSPSHKHPQPESRREKWLGFRIALTVRRM